MVNLVQRVRHALLRGLSLLLIAPIRLYQVAISPLTGPTCKFHPTCSTYAVVALRRHGPFKGLALAGYRIGRCHPWQAGGLDPVPPKHRWRPAMTADGRTVIPLTDLRTSPLTTSQPTRLAA